MTLRKILHYIDDKNILHMRIRGCVAEEIVPELMKYGIPFKDIKSYRDPATSADVVEFVLDDYSDNTINGVTNLSNKLTCHEYYV